MDTLTQRFARKYKVIPNGCWLWTAYCDSLGYGRIVGGEGQPRSAYAHRVSYELFIGKIPDDMEIDHLCRNRSCVNPVHLEAVPHHTNVLRGKAPTAANAQKTHCKRGHSFTPENTGVVHNRRYCKTCNREHAIELYRLKREDQNKSYRPHKKRVSTTQPHR